MTKKIKQLCNVCPRQIGSITQVKVTSLSNFTRY